MHYLQPTATPTRKLAAAGLAAGVVTILVWAVGLAGIVIPSEVAAALTTVVAFTIGYVTHDIEQA